MGANDERFIVVLFHPNGFPVAMTDEDDYQMAVFDSRKEAEEAGRANMIGRSCGYFVYPWPGCDCT